MGMIQNDFAFSIIIPVQNGAKTIERLLGSLIIQKSRIHEVLVCNDHSTDNTLDVIEPYKKILPITVLNVPDELGNSPGNARQVGVDFASGEWIVFADADDIITFNALGCYSNIIQNNPKAKLIVTTFDEVYFEPFQLIEHISNPYAWVHAKAFNTEYIKNNGIRFNEKLYSHEDKYFTFINLFTMRAKGDAEPFVTDITTYYWCRSDNTIVSKNDGKYPMTSCIESVDALIVPVEVIREKQGFSREKIVELFGMDLLGTLLDMYHKIQCSRDVWGDDELNQYKIINQAKDRIRRIKELTGWTDELIVQYTRMNPDLYKNARTDSVRTMREFVPGQSLIEFLKQFEEEG